MYNRLPLFPQLEREFRNTIFSSISNDLIYHYVKDDIESIEHQKKFIRNILPSGIIGRMCENLNYDPHEVAECIINHIVMDENDIKWWNK